MTRHPSRHRLAVHRVAVHRLAVHRLAVHRVAVLVVLAVLGPTAAAGCSDGPAGSTGSAPQVENPTEGRTGAAPDPQTGDQTDGPGNPASPVPRVDATVATGLRSPWGLAVLPDGSALVSERDTGLVQRVQPGEPVRTVGEVPGVDFASQEGGLLGLAVAPTFARDRLVYAYLSTAQDNRVVRMPFRDGRLGRPEVLLDGIPVSAFHNGGRLAFGPDRMLYVTTGDATDGDVAPDPDSLGGKILRVTPTGDPAPGNPEPTSPVWTLGHRNVQGIAWDDQQTMWASEFGQDTWDELNVIEPGNDYGWPRYEGRADAAGVVDPLVQWRPDVASPSGIAYAAGAVWMAGLAGERLWRIVVEDGRVLGEPTAYLTGELGRLRTVQPAPGGGLWLVTSNTDTRGEPRAGDDRIVHLTLR